MNEDSKELTRKSDMLHGRQFHSLTPLASNYIIAVGGCDSKDFTLDVCELYDVSEDQWTKLPRTNVSRSSHAACVIDDSVLYVFCGLDSVGAASNVIECLEVVGGS